MTETAEEFRERLINQYNEIARLAGALAHEIKNPLSTIRLNLDLMIEDLEEPQTQRERRALRKVEVVRDECKRLQTLLDEFLTYARARQMQMRPGNINDVVKKCLDFFHPTAIESGIEVVAYLGNDLPSVMLDGESFYRAILNLLLNAQQAICQAAKAKERFPESGIEPDALGQPELIVPLGQIVVRTHGEGESVILDIIDNGPGMNKAVVQKVFEAFYSTKQGGSGLGLPTTRQIVEAHGGTISVQSEPGKGTQFTIKLPLLPQLT